MYVNIKYRIFNFYNDLTYINYLIQYYIIFSHKIKNIIFFILLFNNEYYT